ADVTCRPLPRDAARCAGPSPAPLRCAVGRGGRCGGGVGAWEGSRGTAGKAASGMRCKCAKSLGARRRAHPERAHPQKPPPNPLSRSEPEADRSPRARRASHHGNAVSEPSPPSAWSAPARITAPSPRVRKAAGAARLFGVSSFRLVLVHLAPGVSVAAGGPPPPSCQPLARPAAGVPVADRRISRPLRCSHLANRDFRPAITRTNRRELAKERGALSLLWACVDVDKG